MNEEKGQRSNLSNVSPTDRHLGKGEMEDHTYNGVYTKIERRKCQKCEAPNEGDLAQMQCIALMKFIMHIIVFIAYLHIINAS